MGFISMVFGDPVKSTADWGVLLFDRVSKRDWEYARAHKNAIFLRMIELRPGTPDSVRSLIQNGYVDSLSQLCWDILVDEGYAEKHGINDRSDIKRIKEQIAQILISKGIPEDLAKFVQK